MVHIIDNVSGFDECMLRFVDATPEEVRSRIESIPDVVELPTKKGTWIIKVDGVKLKSLDKFLYLTGCRISEAVTLQRPYDSERVLNTGLDLTYRQDYFDDEKEIEVAVFNLKTLKRQDHVIRSIAIPVDEKYEPWARQLTYDLARGNPFNIARQHVWSANRIIFDGLYYSTPKSKKFKFKHLANHGLRHIRIKELIQTYGFTPVEVQRWVGWTAQTVGVNPQMDVYFSLVWRDYFSKLLKIRKT